MTYTVTLAELALYVVSSFLLGGGTVMLIWVCADGIKISRETERIAAETERIGAETDRIAADAERIQQRSKELRGGGS